MNTELGEIQYQEMDETKQSLFIHVCCLAAALRMDMLNIKAKYGLNGVMVPLTMGENEEREKLNKWWNELGQDNQDTLMEVAKEYAAKVANQQGVRFQ